VADTLKQVVDQRIVTTLDRTGVWAAQTPQAFRRALLVDAMAHAGDMATFTDEAALCEALNIPVTIVLGSAANLKVTHPSDVVVANALLRATTSQPDQSPVGGNMETTTGDHSPRVGIGYDVHRFVAGRPLVLGGVTIAYPLGLAGHSDADVLLHAIADALLGAGALGDIGLHFPPSDPRFQDADSRGLLRQVGQLVGAAGFVLIHVDATVVAEAPRIGPHVSAMRAAIGECLGLPETAISIKATTNEGMGFVGRGEGIAALATATIRPRGAD
jgi:2-C-methyl-D-erythritol 4-phosphate cytidylyltransferase/2-C-methyl-D-erythritol 2,4-cyclodiphosphate synthase